MRRYVQLRLVEVTYSVCSTYTNMVVPGMLTHVRKLLDGAIWTVYSMHTTMAVHGMPVHAMQLQSQVALIL